MKKFPLDKAFQLIEPGPVVFVTTMKNGRPNIMSMSWHMPIEFTPPQIACIMSDLNYSFDALRSTKECVLAVPTVDLANKVVDIGNCSGKSVDKFKKFKLTPLPAKKVKAPLIAECIANLECRVIDTAMVRKYCLFIMEVVHIWVDPKRKERRKLHHNGDGTFVVDGRKLNLKKRMLKWKDMI